MINQKIYIFKCFVNEMPTPERANRVESQTFFVWSNENEKNAIFSHDEYSYSMNVYLLFGRDGRQKC